MSYRFSIFAFFCHHDLAIWALDNEVVPGICARWIALLLFFVLGVDLVVWVAIGGVVIAAWRGLRFIRRWGVVRDGIVVHNDGKGIENMIIASMIGASEAPWLPGYSLCDLPLGVWCSKCVVLDLRPDVCLSGFIVWARGKLNLVDGLCYLRMFVKWPGRQTILDEPTHRVLSLQILV